jgi:cytosine deaminase
LQKAKTHALLGKMTAQQAESGSNHMTSEHRVLFRKGQLDNGETVDLLVNDGMIAAIEPHFPGTTIQAEEIVDLGGRLLMPALVDGHLHLDKTFLGDRWHAHRPCIGPFDVRERVNYEKEELAAANSPIERASALIEQAIAHGTLHLRTHVDIDSRSRLDNLEALLQVRENYRDLVSIEIIAFPQSGILSDPGTADLLEQAILAGADGVGGIDPAGIDGAVDEHLDIVFGIAARHGTVIDIHLHDPGELGADQIRQIAARCGAMGMHGRVAISHAYALGEIGADSLARTADMLASNGVAIMTNGPGIHSMPPLRPLKEAGVTMFAGSDNVRDSWWPYGNADMLERAMLIGYRAGLFTDDELRFAAAMITTNGATLLQLPDYGLKPGNPADFIAIEAEHVPAAIVTHSHRRSIYRKGRRIADALKLLPKAG